jgi:hypothetical protein
MMDEPEKSLFEIDFKNKGSVAGAAVYHSDSRSYSRSDKRICVTLRAPAGDLASDKHLSYTPFMSPCAFA